MTTITLEQAYQTAIAYQQASRFAEAESLLQQVTAHQPEHAGAWHRRGLIALATNRVADAVELLSRAVAVAPASAGCHSDLGVACWHLGRAEQAIACFQRAITLQPSLAHAHRNLGDVLAASGRFDEAIVCLRRALVLQPNLANPHHSLGKLLARQGRISEAAGSYQRAVELAPSFVEAHVDLADALAALGHLDASIAVLRRALEVDPGCAEALNDLANALCDKEQWDEAIACYQRALGLKPDYVTAQCNLGSAFLRLDRLDDAIAAYVRAIELDPEYPDSYGNLGVAHLRLGHFEEALHCYRRAIACDPGFADGHWNLALLLLLLGRFQEGWREYEWRWRRPIPVSPLRKFSAPQWDGSLARGQTILLHAEQGLGDTIQFVRYASRARDVSGAARVLVECPPELTRLLNETGEANIEFLSREGWDGTALPPFDLHVPLLSLPLTLGMAEPLSPLVPYLRANGQTRARWRERLANSRGLRVGLAWAGRPQHPGDRRRSIAFEKMRPLLRVPGVSFYSLQLGLRAVADPALIDLTVHLTDFAETAALIAELDLVICVDTATAHLAGALGQPVWTLLPFVPDWRWGLGSERTPWYPTMRLFRQPRAGDWEAVIERVAAELQVFVA